MIKAGIIGGAGYTAGELLRILIFHPKVSIDFVQSNSQYGKSVTEIHPDLIGETQLTFTNHVNWEVDVAFICSGHGKTRSLLNQVKSESINAKIIDLSADYRLDADWVYGLTEWNREKIKSAMKLANPGCFATAIQLGLLPLVDSENISSDIHVNAITGSTGAGVIPGSTTHFSWRHSNISVYKPFQHQHLNEIHHTFKAMGEKCNLHFIPVRGNFTRGIFASLYTKFTGSEEEARRIFENYYKNDSFIRLTERNPDLKQVINTNKAIINVQVIDGKILVISMIDNLLKGASGQAVQNMNLMFGFPEETGLNFKSIGF